MRVYLDVDDVLAETTRAIAAWARARFGVQVAFEELRTFELERSLGLTSAQHAELMRAIHEPAFLEALAPMEGAVAQVRALRARGARISVVTGRPPHSRGPTERWLADHGFEFEALHIVDKYDRHRGPGVLPLAALAEHRYDVAVEDAWPVAEHLAALGVRVLLFDRPWNRHAPGARGVRRVRGWAEVGPRAR